MRPGEPSEVPTEGCENVTEEEGHQKEDRFNGVGGKSPEGSTRESQRSRIPPKPNTNLVAVGVCADMKDGQEETMLKGMSARGSQEVPLVVVGKPTRSSERRPSSSLGEKSVGACGGGGGSATHVLSVWDGKHVSWSCNDWQTNNAVDEISDRRYPSEWSEVSFGGVSQEIGYTVEYDQSRMKRTSEEMKVFRDDELSGEGKNIRQVRLVSWISVILTLALGILCCVMGSLWTSLSLFALGLEMLIDFLSSVAVLWRFGFVSDPGGGGEEKASFSRCTTTPTDQEHNTPTTKTSIDSANKRTAAESVLASVSARRERKAAFCVGALLVALGVYVFADGLVDLLVGSSFDSPTHRRKAMVVVCSVTWPSAAVFSILSCWKMLLAKRLQSQVILKDATCSAFGVCLSVVTGIASAVELSCLDSSNAANLGASPDSVAAVVIALLVFVEGLRTMLQNSVNYKAPIELQV
eukprot:GHVS01033412.1.p1 GENE.GHVS01033412.1~~GHVS01033412.1.p1  ORF type:complete len:466 (+),score=84.70 GHVS01033412.1:59-1456(+)